MHDELVCVCCSFQWNECPKVIGASAKLAWVHPLALLPLGHTKQWLPALLAQQLRLTDCPNCSKILCLFLLEFFLPLMILKAFHIFFFSHSWETPAIPGLQPHHLVALFGQQVQIQPWTLFQQQPTRQLWLIWSIVPPHRHLLPLRWIAPTTHGACGGPPWAGTAMSPGLAPLTMAIKIASDCT